MTRLQIYAAKLCLDLVSVAQYVTTDIFQDCWMRLSEDILFRQWLECTSWRGSLCPLSDDLQDTTWSGMESKKILLPIRVT